VVDVADESDFELLAELLSLPNSAAALNLSTPRKREKLFEVLLRQLAVLARQQPVLTVFEDVHWIDPTSRELLDLMIDAADRHVPPGVSTDLDRPAACHDAGAEPA
jgi:predicted ATPase